MDFNSLEPLSYEEAATLFPGIEPMGDPEDDAHYAIPESGDVVYARLGKWRQIYVWQNGQWDNHDIDFTDFRV